MLYINNVMLVYNVEGLISEFFNEVVPIKYPILDGAITRCAILYKDAKAWTRRDGYNKYEIPCMIIPKNEQLLHISFTVLLRRSTETPTADPEISVSLDPVSWYDARDLMEDLSNYILENLPIKTPQATYLIDLEPCFSEREDYTTHLEVMKKMVNGEYGFKPNDDYTYTLANAMMEAANFVRCKVVHEFFALNSENGIAWKYHSGFMKLVSSVSGEVGPKIVPLNLGNTYKRISVLVKLSGKYPTSKTFEAKIELDFAKFALYDVGVTTDIGMQITSELKDYICRELGLFNKQKIDYNMIAPRGCGKTKAQAEILYAEALAGKHVAFIGRNYEDSDMYKKCMDYCKEDLEICSRSLKTLHKEYLDRRDDAKPIWTDESLADLSGVMIKEIEKVIFNNPAAIVFWKDGTKTTVTAKDEPFDEEKGLSMAIAKKVLGNNYAAGGRFKAILKHAERVESKEKAKKSDPVPTVKVTKTSFIKDRMSEGFTRKEATAMWEREHNK